MLWRTDFRRLFQPVSDRALSPVCSNMSCQNEIILWHQHVALRIATRHWCERLMNGSLSTTGFRNDRQIHQSW